MAKKVFVIHGWGGYPKEGWFPWLKKELEKKGFEVEIPAMPDSENPKIAKWVSFLAKLVKKADKDTYFVGHSIGCQTIMRYLETLSGKEKIGGTIFVAGWFTLMNLETDEEKEIAKPWLEEPIDFDKVKKHGDKFVVIFSDNDPYVPIENKRMFESKLKARTMIEHNKGHFSGNDKVTKIPVVLDELLKMTK